MEMQSMYAEYEYRRRVAAIQATRVSIWRRIMG